MASMRVYTREFVGAFTNQTPTDAIPVNVEKSIYNWAIRKCKHGGDVPSWENRVFCEYYKRKSLSIKYNLANPCSGLVERLVSGEVSTKSIVDMAPNELWPTGKWDTALLALELKQVSLDLAAGRLNEKTVGIFKCARCKSMKTSYYEMQTRSADEPMTAFITCINCGKRWKS